MSFVATRNKGYAMTFDNGFTISVQWGTENYCEKKNTTIHPTDPMKHTRWDSLSAEIAVFERHSMGERMLSISSDGVDDVIGWLGTDDVAKVIAIVQSAHPDNEEEMVEKIKELGL
jgi:hypothetical protein